MKADSTPGLIGFGWRSHKFQDGTKNHPDLIAISALPFEFEQSPYDVFLTGKGPAKLDKGPHNKNAHLDRSAGI